MTDEEREIARRYAVRQLVQGCFLDTLEPTDKQIMYAVVALLHTHLTNDAIVYLLDLIVRERR